MNNDAANYEEITEYEVKRARLKAHYTARLKAISATDPGYARLWDERANALRNLASAYGMPDGIQEQQ